MRRPYLPAPNLGQLAQNQCRPGGHDGLVGELRRPLLTRHALWANSLGGQPAVCDGTQNVGRYRYRYFFPVLNIFDTDTGTFFRYQIFPIPVPRLFSDTKFDRYRFRDFFPVPNFSDTGSDTTIKMKNSRYRYLYGTGTHYKSLKFLNFGNETQFRYQIFPIPVPRLFSGTKFRRYRFRDFLSVPNLTDTGSETFFRYQFVPIPVPIPPKKLKIPDTGNSRYRYVTLCCTSCKNIFV